MKLQPVEESNGVVAVAIDDDSDVRPPSDLLLDFVNKVHDKRLRDGMRTGEFENQLRHDVVKKRPSEDAQAS